MTPKEKLACHREYNKRRRGRPSLYSDKLAEKILDALAAGESLVDVCKADAMPSVRTVLQWASDDPEFSQRYARAREAQAEYMDNLVVETAKGAKADPQAARVQIDAYKWRAAKLAPKKYGNRLDVTSGGEPVQMDDAALAVRGAAMLRLIETALSRDDE